jgi:hypothetical protein
MKNSMTSMLVMLSSMASAQVTDFGMTSDAHSKHVGEIVFSKSPIQFQSENPDWFAKEFKSDEEIYFMAYFPKSIANKCLEEHGVLPDWANANITFSFFVNNEKAGSIEVGIDGDQLNKWTGWSDPSKPFNMQRGMLTQYGFLFRDEVITRLKKGDNEVKMVLGYKVQKDGNVMENKTPLTEGEMILKAEKDYVVEFEAPPAAAMNNPELEKKVFDALAFRWRKNTVIKKVILTERKWRTEYNALGVPIASILKVYAITSPKDGEYANSCFATPFEVKKEYLENGQLSDEVKWHSSGGRPNYEVSCDAI